MDLRRLRVFTNRTEAGRQLARQLKHYSDKPDTMVIGLPRGGVVTAAAIAEELHLPLDVLVVRKLGAPHHEELAMGAVAPGVQILNDDVVELLGIQRDEIELEAAHERAEVARREKLFRGEKPPIVFAGQTAILADDGLATGSTMAAAIKVARQQGAARIVVAVPVAPPETISRLRRFVEEVVCLETPRAFYSVSQWYVDFAQVEDDEVIAVLQRAGHRTAV